MNDEQEFDNEAIAIVGIAGRFPGAENVDELWCLLKDGLEGSVEFAASEIDALESKETSCNTNYVRKRGAIAHVEDFDAHFFGLRPLEARVMDPQQRIFLEICYDALESAGCVPGKLNGSIGVFATASQDTYRERYLNANPSICQSAGDVSVRIGNDLDYLASNISYRLNLNGPAVTLRTACSSSLVAVANGCRALRDYECDAVLAGGVSVSVPQSAGYLHQPGSILSPDGHCRTFDKNARGTYFSNGAAVVLLKRLEDAIADGDEIWAKIIGCAVNNDGANRASFTAPSVMGQAEVITMAQEMADIDPSSISYIEAHGTATEVGDPIEIEALTAAFRRKTDRKQFCEIGSIKSNLGHLDVAAGIAGLIKVALALKHEYLPPSINFETPNPNIDFESSPFRVIADGHAWTSTTGPRRAGVSAFGTGGTNAHVILEESPQIRDSNDISGDKLLLLSARSEQALAEKAGQLATVLATDPTLSMTDVEHTLRERRSVYEYRQFLVCRSAAHGADALTKKLSKFTGSRHYTGQTADVVMMFPGQGTQYPGMGLGLYESNNIYRHAADECLKILDPILGNEFRTVLFSADRDSPNAIKSLTNTAYAQPAIFLVEYALAKMWFDRGVVAKAYIGHSVGEFVAACLSGVMSLTDALRLVTLRGQLMQEQPAGKMLSARTSLDKIKSDLPGDISVACINSPSLIVLSGPQSAIETCQKDLEKKDIVCRLLHTSHAFHSSMMQPVVEPMLKKLKGIQLHSPTTPIMSTVTGEWLDESDSSNPAYWANHALRTVRFADGVRGLLESDFCIFLECGSRMTLSTLVRQQFAGDERRLAVASLGEEMNPDAERVAALRAIGELWAGGVDIVTSSNRSEVDAGRVVRLPTYPFQRERLWVDSVPPTVNVSPTAHPISTTHQSTPISGEKVMSITTAPARTDLLSQLILKVLGDTFGSDLSDTDKSMGFVELGFDSLFLTQVSGKLAKETGIDITFRQMLEDFPSPAELARHLDEVLPPDAFQPVPQQQPFAPDQLSVVEASRLSPIPVSNPDSLPGESTLDRLLAGQLDIMRCQLEYVQSIGANIEGGNTSLVPTQAPRSSFSNTKPSPPPDDAPKKPFGPMARVNRGGDDRLTDGQLDFISRLTERYVEKTAKSRAYTQASRKCLADPRTVSGFHPLWKEMVYPIITVESSGSMLVDIDGNRSIDVTNGFGTILFGHSPDFIVDAISKQLRSGYETGPQSILAGEAASLVAELTGHERVAFANTGSEAVLAAMRMARTCRGRDLIVVFAGSYHGIFDEVVSRGSSIGGVRRTLPAAPGIPASALDNILVLDYGTKESLEIIESQSDDIAAVMTEAVQGGNPSNLPVDFLRELRRITAAKNVPLIFDEVVTGFRTHPGGIQGLLDIKADIATYGKVCGGGLPIGIVAGSAKFMDSLDGGHWQYGDSSRPEANMTFFAGTFMRHPLALAACTAVLRHLKAAGPALQSALNDKMTSFAGRLNDVFRKSNVPMKLNHFSSFSRLELAQELPYAGLLFYLLRERDVHIWEGRAVILTTAHDDKDLDYVINAFRECIAELQSVGLLPAVGQEGDTVNGSKPTDSSSPLARENRTIQAPVPGATLGRTDDGYPAWFVNDPDVPDSFIQVGEPLTSA